MNSKVKQFKAMFMLISLLLVGLIMLNGCKKSEPAPSETPAETMDEPAEAVAAVVEQATCPVMVLPSIRPFSLSIKARRCISAAPAVRRNLRQSRKSTLPSCHSSINKDRYRYQWTSG